MRLLAILLAAALAIPAAAQEKKPARKSEHPAHSKPTPQQIRKFNQLEKKEELEKKEQPAKKAKPR
jgi:hypothetical protein